VSLNLVEIDGYLKSIEKRELVYIYIMIVGGIFFLSYYFLFNSSEKKLAETKKSKNRVVKKIRKYKNYLSFHDDFEIAQGKKSIDKLKIEIDELKNKKSYINSQLLKLSNIIYNKASWTKFLNRISILASTIGVELLSMKNQFLESKKGFDKHLMIELTINSNYRHTVTFIDKLEKSQLIVNIETIDMKLTEDGVVTDLTLSVWGIKR